MKRGKAQSLPVNKARPEIKATGDAAAPLRPIEEVVFGIVSPEYILGISATHPHGLTEARIYEVDGSFAVGGVFDARMGTSQQGVQCKTCEGLVGDCPGHFGHINLGLPVYNPCFVNKVMKILRMICYYCGRLKVGPKNKELEQIQSWTKLNPRTRYELVYRLCKKTTRCERADQLRMGDAKKHKDGCEGIQPKYKMDGLEIVFVWTSNEEDGLESRTLCHPAAARRLLESIPDADCELMGIDPKQSRPEWMIPTVLGVPPVTVRPVATTGACVRNQDDITMKLVEIIDANNKLKECIHNLDPDFVQPELFEKLQYHVATMIDNNISGVSRSNYKISGKPIRCLKSRLNGKEGRIRGNLMGKRVDHSARTVITPDPNLKLDEVGVPKQFAERLRIPERVTPLNKDRLQKLVDKRGESYPCARRVMRPDARPIQVDMKLPGLQRLMLQDGFVVERDLMDGDPVVFNRQPSLHKMSMMAHRVKVLPHSTLRLNLSCTSPYNADFDGDEMNMHVPQTIGASTEVETLLLTPKQIVSPQSNRPVMGIVQDALLGAYKLTKRDTFMDRGFVMNALMMVSNWNGIMPQPCIIKPIRLWSGKQLLSTAIPDKLNLKRVAHTNSGHESDQLSEDAERDLEWISTDDTTVLIENGELLCGILGKNTLGTSSGSLIHICMMDLGSEQTKSFIDDLQSVVQFWVSKQGFSVGIRDCMIDKEAGEKVKVKLSAAKVAVDNQLRKSDGDDSVESRVNTILNEAMEQVGRIANEGLSNSNSFKSMATAGSKGSLINLAQITACIGQMNVEGKRIPNGYGDRTLPHFDFHCNTPEAKGFVENSFFSGLSPSECFFQAMAGREGLIDTAIKTGEIGYVQRRLMKALESTSVCYDNTVRNAVGQVVQFCYGEDGMAGEKLEHQRISALEVSDADFERLFKFNIPELYAMHQWESIFSSEVLSEIVSDYDKIRSTLDVEWKNLKLARAALAKYVRTGEEPGVLPCNLDRILWNVRNAHKVAFPIGNRRCDINPLVIIEEVKKLVSEFSVVLVGDTFADASATLLFSFAVRSFLCPKLVAEKYRLSKEAFDDLIRQIKDRFNQAKIHPGEMVGALAAQSIGEPATQMTLNTFHFAGVSAKNVTLGIPRLKEIVNLSKTSKSSFMTVFLAKNFSKREEDVADLTFRLKTIKFSDMVESCTVYEDRLEQSLHAEDQSFINAFLQTEDYNPKMFFPWVLRFVLDKKSVVCSKLPMDNVASCIRSFIGGYTVCIWSDDNSAELVVRVQSLIPTKDARKPPLVSPCRMKLPDKIDEMYFRQASIVLTSKLILRGSPQIGDVLYRRAKLSDYFSLFKKSVPEDWSSDPEWIIEITGSDLLYVLQFKEVDAKRILTSDIWDMRNVFGLEAARKVIEVETRRLMNSYGLYINCRHISLLCDTMVSDGVMMPITRYGVGKRNYGPLMRCSFEQAADALIDAATCSERDKLLGVSEQVIVGQMPKIGTGIFDLVLNDHSCLNAVGPSSSAISVASELPPSKHRPTAKSTTSGLIDVYEDHENYKVPTVSYAPKSPEYRPASGQYIPKSPTYVPPEVTYAPKSPEYRPTSMQYIPKSPTYVPSKVTYAPKSPEYRPVDAGCAPKSPDYRPIDSGWAPKSPDYHPSLFRDMPKSPDYGHSFSTSYVPHSPPYRPVLPVSIPGPSNRAAMPSSNASAYFTSNEPLHPQGLQKPEDLPWNRPLSPPIDPVLYRDPSPDEEMSASENNSKKEESDLSTANPSYNPLSITSNPEGYNPKF